MNSNGRGDGPILLATFIGGAKIPKLFLDDLCLHAFKRSVIGGGWPIMVEVN